MMPSASQEVLNLHRAFDIGNSGFRQVLLTVMSNGVAALSYSIDHYWKRESSSCKSVMAVNEPKGLRGTAVLVVEEQGRPEMNVWLKLATSKRAVQIASDRQCQLFLGTDFSYEDLRFWYPIDSVSVDSVEKVSCGPDQLSRLVGRRLMPNGRTAQIELGVLQTGALAFVNTVGLIRESGSRTLKADRWACVQGRVHPTLVTVTHKPEMHVSKMELAHIRFDLDVGDVNFSKEGLERMSHTANTIQTA